MFQINFALWGFNNYRQNVLPLFILPAGRTTLSFRVNEASFGAALLVPRGIAKDLFIQYEIGGIKTTILIQSETGSNQRTFTINTVDGSYMVDNSERTHAPGHIHL